MPAQSLYPNARRADLVVEELKNELLIYDRARDQASCLNQTAALVWKFADGKTSVSEIATQLERELKSPVDVGVVWYALDQLSKKNLLQERVTPPLQYSRITRRDFIVKAGLVGAAVAIPVIISLTAPSPAMAATCPSGCSCTITAECTGSCAGLTCSGGCCQ